MEPSAAQPTEHAVPAWRDRVLDLVADLAREVSPDFPAHPTIHSRLDRDLGFDSLTMIELRDRVERAWGISIPDETLASAETVRDLLRVIEHSSTAAIVQPVRHRTESTRAFEGAPTSARTLVEAIAWHVERHRDRVHVRILKGDRQFDDLTYGELWNHAEAIASGLQRAGLEGGASVALMLPTGRDYLAAMLGVWRAGGVPVPIYPPLRPQQLEDHLRRQERILDNAGAVHLLTIPEGRRLARWLRTGVPSLDRVTTVPEVASSGKPVPVHVRPDDTALLQYTSGSTGNPKGVVLDHAALLANLRSMGRAAEIASDDVFVSWLPLYHDMGLIGAWMGSLYFGMTLVLMSPQAFVSRPARWLWAIHDHRGTVTGAPNFGYELCLRRVDEREVEGLDLGSLRLAFNGAEPVSPDTVERFQGRFARFGLRASAIAPVYGLAEAAVGLTFPPTGRGPVIDAIDREQFVRWGRATPAGPDRPRLRFVACGRALPGYQVRVVDRRGRELPERREGRIEFSGPSATKGYFRDPQASRRLRRDGWTDTGDLGYRTGADLYVTGRVKDLVIRAGRNIHPDVIEAAIGDVPGVRRGCVAVFGSTDPATQTERLVVVAETRETAPAALTAMHGRVVERVTDALGAPPSQVVLAAPGAVLKTSSGKIRRAATRDDYENGRLGAGRRWARWKVVRFAIRDLLGRVASARRRGLRLAYGGWAWLMVAAVGLPAWALMSMVPGEGRRRRLARGAAKSLLWLTGVPVDIEGLDPAVIGGAAVIVVNHASLSDAVVLAAVLPPRSTFVAARDWSRRPFTGRVLRRVGCEFVARDDRLQAPADVRRIAERLREGALIVVFPEGGLAPVAALRPFRLGPFAAAVDGHASVIPVALRGTRELLPPGGRVPRRGRVRVLVGTPFDALAAGWNETLRLRKQARTFILDHCGDADLV